MKRSTPLPLLLALLSVFMAVPACPGCPGLVNTPTNPDGGAADGPTAFERFGTCTTDVIKDRANGLLDDVASAVATGDYKTQLKNLAVSAGWAEAKCAVDLFIDMMTGRKASADALAAAQLQRAQDWRAENP